MRTIVRSTLLVACLAVLGTLITTAAFAQTAQYASGWTASAPDWTPAPPNSNPLGPPDSNCTGTSNAGAVWAQFTFPSFGLPGGATIVGIEVNVNYGSVVAPDMQLYLSGSPVGSTRVLPDTPPAGSCNASVVRTAGGPADLWGAGLTAADFNTAGAVAIRLTRTTGPDMPRSIDIESVELVVYTTADNDDPDCSGAAIADQIADAVCQAVISGADVTGVTDPDGDPLTITVNPTTLALGANTVTVMADDGNGGTCQIDVNVNVIDVTDPVVTCPADATLNADANTCTATYAGPPATATDNCSVNVSSSPALPALFSGVGDNTITYTATDGAGNTATCDQTVTVEDNTPPQITCPADVTLQADAMCKATYAGPPATATDACDASPDVASAPPLPATFMGVGDNTISYTATDDEGNVAACDQTVSLEDVTPPTITVAAGPLSLWPPNHKYRTVGLDAIVTDAADNCSAVTAADVVTTSASSDEPENAQGDGNTTDDIVIAGDCRSVDLRAERQGGGNGRVYALNLGVSDASGNVGTNAFEVHVPHSKKSGAVDDGPAYSEAGCTPVPVARLATAEETEALGAAMARLKDASGETPEDALEVAEEKPETFALESNYPNPFNPETRIRFAVPEAAHVTLTVYDVLGRQVRVLVDAERAAGLHEAVFDAATLPSGTYLYRLETPAGSFTGTMLLVK